MLFRSQGLLLKGSALASSGNAQAAIDAFGESADLFTRTGNVHRLANALANRAEQWVTLGEFARAGADAAAAAGLYEQGFTDPGPDCMDRPGSPAVRQRDQQGVDSMRKLQARILLGQGKPAEALALLEALQQANPGIATSWQNCDVSLLMAEALLRMGDLRPDTVANMRRLLQEGRAFYEVRNMTSLLVDADAIEGELYRALRDEAAAQRCLARARNRLQAAPDAVRAKRLQALMDGR